MALGDYTPTAWVNDTTPAITATTLGHIETKVDELDLWDAGVKAGTSTIAGVKFPAVQVPSADVNTLDDYEENIYSPVLAFGGASVGITYSTQSGWSRKIGSLVAFGGLIVLTSKGTSTGNATLSLPLASSVYASVTLGVNVISFADMIHGDITPSSLITLYETTNAGVRTTITNSDFADTSSVYFSGVFSV